MKTEPALSRRRFMKGTFWGGLGAMAADRMVMAQALLSAKTPEEIQAQGFRDGVVNLASNENPLGPSPKAIEAVAKHMFDVNRYHWSLLPDPVEILINSLERKHGIPVTETTPDNGERVSDNAKLVLSSGSSTILHAAAVATIRDKAEMVQARPAYDDISDIWWRFKKEEETDAKINYVRLTRDYRHNLNAMFNKINNKTTIVVITNPNNPTSTVLDHEAVVDFVKSVPKHVTVFIDEAYIDYTSDPAYRDAVYLALEHENVVVSRTFSKIYGLAGLRVGYAILSPRLKQRFSLHNLGGPPSVLGATAAAAALDDHVHYEQSRRIVEEGKVYLGRSLDKLGIEHVPSDSCFVLFNLKRPTESVFNGLIERNVQIADARWWGLKEHLRVTVGTQNENEAFINTLEKVL